MVISSGILYIKLNIVCAKPLYSSVLWQLFLNLWYVLPLAYLSSNFSLKI